MEGKVGIESEKTRPMHGEEMEGGGETRLLTGNPFMGI
jgi:hypothetical protein